MKFDQLVKNIEAFIDSFLFPFCIDSGSAQQELLKINSQLRVIKKIKQSQKKSVQLDFQEIYVKIWNHILRLLQGEPRLRVYSNYVAILQLIHNLDSFIEISLQHLCFNVKSQENLNTNFFIKFFKIKKNSIKSQILRKNSELNDFKKRKLIIG